MTRRPDGTEDDGTEDDGSGTDLSRALVCARCGTVAEAPPATWTLSVEAGVRRYYCEVCARENLRAIEGRLDAEWW
ncbi:hypothetical protein [Streptomyces sp. bgisy022]|uniref:hypothetical protein n=1 Tax=Streptomyces sp. bgisy022 TaxID=3413769 RepID=UPI003D759568